MTFPLAKFACCCSRDLRPLLGVALAFQVTMTMEMFIIYSAQLALLVTTALRGDLRSTHPARTTRLRLDFSQAEVL